MTKDNFKENDIFVSTLFNPESNTNDLAQAGLNTTNTQFLSADDYKTSEFVKKAFTNQEGKFDEEAFSKAYMAAAYKYNDLAFQNTAQGIKDLEYNSTDIYAPAGAKTKTPSYTIERITNPYESITGLRSLFGTAESNKSTRELAQKSAIYDTATGQYLDKSAEDLGLIGGLFSKPLVYAKWHEDGEHQDPITGRTVKHRKGEYRLNDDGKFFTETIGKKQGYDEEFVALSDILTKEDSWLNKFDFFDSDDKEKSAFGTIAKVAASVAPYFIPGVNTVWGGLTMAMGLASVMPAFAKALEGIVVGDKETGFTSSMNLMENYFKRFDKSVSDEGQTKTFGLEQFGSTIADIFAQLYQMRAAASLSKLFINYNGAEKQAFNNLLKNHGNEISTLMANGTIKPTQEGLAGFFKEIADQTPELKNLLSKQSQLSRGLSMGYMALITSGDVYKEALEGGYSRRAAGTASLAAVLGQYWMMNTLDDRISSWFLDSVVGYNEFANRKIIKDSLKPLWDRIEESVNKIPQLSTEAKQKEFAGLFSKIGNRIKNGYYSILDGTSEFWSRSLAETVEEVSEEAMMDATKGMFDTMSYFGLLGDKNDEATFNTIQNTFSKEGLVRYAQNALGGFLGGGLFHLQEHYVEPFLRGEKIPKATEIDLIKGIQNGEAENYKILARQLGKRDGSISPAAYLYKDQPMTLSTSEGAKTRGEVISDAVVQHIEYLQGILNQYNADLTPDELLSKAIRDRGILKAIQDSDIHKLILDDFDSNIADLAKLREKLDPLEASEKPTVEQEKEKKELSSKVKELEKKVTGFLDGEQEEYYLKAALAYLNPAIRDNISNVTLYAFAKAKTGKEWDDITDKETIKKQYKEWVDNTDQKQQIKLLVDTMDLLEPEFSPAFDEYAKQYTDIRKQVIESVLADSNFDLADSLNDKNFQTLLQISTATKNSGLKGVTLEDVLKIDSETAIRPIVDRIYADNKTLFDGLAQAGGISPEDFLKKFSNVLANTVNKQPIEQWDSSRFDTLIKDFFTQITSALEGTRPDLELLMQQYKTPENIREDFAKQALKSYIESQSTIDNELLKRLKTMAQQSVSDSMLLRRFNNQLENNLIADINDYLPGDEEYIESLQFTQSQIKELRDVITTSISNGEGLDSIIQKITDKVIDNFKHSSDPLLEQVAETQLDRSLVENFVKDFIGKETAFDDVRFLDKNKDKAVVKNPLYDLLRNLSFQLSPDVNTTIFDLLQNESANLSGLYDISEYIKMPDVVEQIQNAKSILQIAKAIVAGMEDDVNNPGRLFSYNSQVKKYLTEFKKGENADKYKTLGSRDVYSIIDDLDLLISKLDFIEKLTGMNTESQAAEDKKTRDSFNNIIIDKLKSNASKLQINGVSIATPDDLAGLNDDKLPLFVRVGRFQHNMFTKFKEIIDSGTSVDVAIATLLNNLNIDIKGFCKTSLDSVRLNKDIKEITDYDWIVWLATTLGVDANSYYYKYKEYLNKNADSSVVPMYIQELNTHIAYSVLADTLGVHNAVQKYVIEKSGGYPADTKNIIFTDGVSGSGKTTVIAKTLLEFTPESSIMIAAPNNDTVTKQGQAQKLKESLGLSIADDKVLDKEHLLKYFITDETYTKLQTDSAKDTFASDSFIQLKKVENVGVYRCLSDNVTDSIFRQSIDSPKLLFIDEVTHFNTAELQILDKAAEKFGFKIIALGDTYQESANIGSQEAHIDQVFAWKGPRLGISSRPANVNKKDNIDRFQVALDSYYNELKTTNNQQAANTKLASYLQNTGLLLKYFDDGTVFAGDKIVDTISAEDLNKLKQLSNGEKILIVTNLDDAGNITDAAFKATLQGSSLTENDYELRSPEKIHPRAIQGAESKYCVINESGLLTQNDADAIKKLYTIITRSQEGSLIKLSPEYVNKLHIQNTPTSKPSIYKLPGSNQTQEIRTERITDIGNIIGSYSMAAPTSQPSSSPTTQGSETQQQPQLPDGNTNQPTEEQKEEEIKKMICYGFYNHSGLRQDGDKYVSGKRQVPLDLGGMPNQEFSLDGVQGYFKLKNLIALRATSVDDIKLGLRPSNFTSQIAQFAREINPTELTAVSDADALKWISDNIKIDQKPYVVGVKMDHEIDLPMFKFGFNLNMAVGASELLLLMARHVTIGNFSTYVSTGSLPKSNTVKGAKNTYVANTIAPTLEVFENKATKALQTKQMVVYESPEQFEKLGKADGRFVHKKDGEEIFTTLRQLEKGGVNIKEVMMISGEKNPDGTYKFVEWAKKYNPALAQIAFVNGKFALAGRYMVRVAYTDLPDTSPGISVTDHVFIVDLAHISTEEAIKKLKSISGNLKEKKEILHAYSYSQLATNILAQMGAFTVGTALPITKIIGDFKAELEKNASMHQSKIAAIDNFIAKNKVIDAKNIQELFKADSSITTLLTDFLVSGTNSVGIEIRRYGRSVPIDKNLKLYQNVAAAEVANDRGCLPIANDYMDKLGLTTGHYEPPIFGLSNDGINGMTEVTMRQSAHTNTASSTPPSPALTPASPSSPTTITPEPPKPVPTPISEPPKPTTPSSNTSTEIDDDLVDFFGASVNTEGTKENKAAKLISENPEKFADYRNIFIITENGIEIDEAYEDLFEEDWLDDFNNETTTCNY